MAENRGKFLKFIWKVENFSYIWNETNDFLKSPDFYLDIYDGSAWCLKLYPRGRRSYEKYVGVYLERLSSRGIGLEITLDYEIALLRPNGATEYVKEMKDRCFIKGYKCGFDNLVVRERILGAKKSTLLPEDVLTLQCCIFPKNAELETYTEVIAKTQTELEHYRRQWKAIDYTIVPDISLNWDDDAEFRWLQLILSRESDNQSDVLTGHFEDTTHLKAFYCKIGVLDSNNSVVKHLVDKFLDTESASEGFLRFPLITVSELLKNTSLYLPNGELNLDIEFTLCYGLQHSRIERIARDATFTSAPGDETASTSQIDLSSKKFLYCIDNIPSSLKKDFHNLLQEGTICDFTIKVGDKDFQVHKAVLCARSPVFKAMLTSNMKENEKNMVNISDLEEDTVHRMLTFMYTDMAGNIDWETSNKLYFAADKYGIITLKRICSEVLKQNLCIRNVGEVLVLANMHTDEYLKEKTVEFICDHETEVLCSAEWKTFMADELLLAAETMHSVFLKKGKNRH